MTATVVTYLVFVLLALAIGAVLGAALHRTVIADQLLDLDGEVQGLRMRLAEAQGRQEHG